METTLDLFDGKKSLGIAIRMAETSRGFSFGAAWHAFKKMTLAPRYEEIQSFLVGKAAQIPLFLISKSNEKASAERKTRGGGFFLPACRPCAGYFLAAKKWQG